VSSGSTVYAYNATTGQPDMTNHSLGQFTAPPGFGDVTSIGSTDTVTVLGNDSALLMIDLAKSLQTGMAQLAAGNPVPFVPNAQQYTLLGGLTSVPGSTTIYGAISAHFNTLQPQNVQLGFQPANTVRVTQPNVSGSTLTYSFAGGTPFAYTAKGNF